MRRNTVRAAVTTAAVVALTFAFASWAYGSAAHSVTTRSIAAGNGSLTLTAQSVGDAGRLHGNTNNWTSPVDSSGAFPWFNKPVDITDFAFPSRGNGVVALSSATYSSNTGGGYSAPHALVGPYRLSDDGVYSIAATGTDTVGDVGGQVAPAFGIDQEAPVVTTDRVAFYGGTPTVTVSATDTMSGVENVIFNVDGNSNDSWEPDVADPAHFSVGFPFAGQGVHTFNWAAFDNAGNETQGTETFVVDNTAPVTTCDALASYVGDATIHMSATDNVDGSGVAHTYSILDGAPQVEGTTIFVPAPASGTASHTVECWSVDAVGNIEMHAVHTFTVGHKLATSTTLKVSAKSVKSGGYVTLTAKLSGGAFAAGTTINFEQKSAGKSSYTLLKTVKVGTSGAATYRFKAVGKGTRYFRVKFLGTAKYLAAPVKTGIALKVL